MPIPPPKIRPESLEAMYAPTGIKPPLKPYIAKLFQDDDSYGFSLFVGATRILSIEELADFDPYTTRLELQDELKLRWIDGDIFGRLMAAVSIVTTDLFYQDLPSFIEICNVLSGTPSLTTVWDPADVNEMCWAVAEAQLIDPADSAEDNAFAEEILAYMGYTVHNEGFFSKPKMLSKAILPAQPSPAEITTDPELLAAVIATDNERHDAITEMLQENTRRLVSQVEPLLGNLSLATEK